MKLVIKLIFALLITNVSLSQYNGIFSDDVYKKKKKYPGYVILNSGDTVGGYIKAKDPVANEKSVEFFENEDDRKATKKYKAKELKGYGFAHLTYLTMHYSGGLTSKPVRFLLVRQKGAIKECLWYSLEQNMVLTVRSSGQSKESFFNQKFPSKTVYFTEGQKPLPGDALLFGFAKKMSKLTIKHTSLSNKIKNKEKGYRLFNIDKVIVEYNDWFENK